MNPQKSKLLVIDASIVGQNEYPTSKQCRDLLNAILDICHKVIITPKISEEWKAHELRFIKRWRRRMDARKKIIIKNPSAKDRLKKKINRQPYDPVTLEAILKDFRLIEASLDSDKIIISLDDTARDYYADLSTHIAEIQSILWLNPAQESFEALFDWLQRGAKPLKKWTLGYHTPRSHRDVRSH